MSEPLPFLPYHCEALNVYFLRSPCTIKLAQIKALRTRFPGGFLGPLEHCVACKGKDLITREVPAGAVLSPPAEKDETMAVVKFKDWTQAEKTLGPGVLDGKEPPAGAPASLPAPPRTVIKGQFCKHHPEIESHKNKNGKYTGLCRQCLRDRAARNSRNRGGKEVASGRSAAPSLTVMTPLSPEAITRGREIIKKMVDSVRGVPPESGIAPHLACKNHSDRLARVDRLGRTMRFCQECLEVRGRKTGQQNFANSTPPVTIPLNAPEYVELKEWLVAQAAEFERTLAKEIMYRLKIAMREAQVLG